MDIETKYIFTSDFLARNFRCNRDSYGYVTCYPCDFIDDCAVSDELMAGWVDHSVRLYNSAT